MSMIGPETQVVLHDHREGEPCNERCTEVPRASELARGGIVEGKGPLVGENDGCVIKPRPRS